MSLIVLGTQTRPQVVDTEAIKVLEVVKRNNKGSQLIVRNERGTELGIWTPPPRSASGAKHTDEQKTELAQQKLREITAIVLSEKPKAKQVVHNFTGFVLEPNPEPEAVAEEPVETAAETT